MQKAIITGERKAGLVEAPDPRPKENWALVKILATPMCTEYKAWLAGHPAQHLGHEAVGEVVAVAQPCRVKPGDRVVVMPLYPCGKCELCVAGDYIHCENMVDFAAFTGSNEGSATYAQYILKPDWLLPAIPQGMPYERAGLALCALGPSFGALHSMGVSAFDTILITGLGPVGLGGVVNARFRGARVIAVEAAPWRAERAAQMGVTVLDPGDPEILGKIKVMTDGKGVDCALDCAGKVQAQRLCIDAARRKGKVAFVGECSDELSIRVSPDMIRKGLTLIGDWHYPLQVTPLIFKVIQESPLIDLLVSHVMPMRCLEDAFALQARGECAKILLKPWEE
jgi:threonine dehydrogenase-like Zn-dependent dehydrogenase